MAAILEAEGALPKAERRALAALMADLRGADLMDAQARYVALFDHARSLSLHLYEHSHGESRDRGQAMVNLLNHYRSKGLDLGASRAAGLPAAVSRVPLDPAGGRGAGPARPGGRGRGAAAGAAGAARRALCRRVPGDRGARPAPGRRGDDPRDRGRRGAGRYPGSARSRLGGGPRHLRQRSGAAAGSGCSAASAMVARFAPPPGAGTTAHRSGTR